MQIQNISNIAQNKFLNFKNASSISRQYATPKATIELDSFIKAGEFQNGTAIYKGEPLNGKIEVGNNPHCYILEYENGNLINSRDFSQHGSCVGEKIYSQDEFCKMVQTKKQNCNGEEYISSETVITPDKITTVKKDLINDTIIISERQQDGSWETTREYDEFNPENPDGAWWRVKENLSTGETVKTLLDF